MMDKTKKWLATHPVTIVFIALCIIYVALCIVDAKRDTGYGYWVAMVLVWWFIIWAFNKYFLKPMVARRVKKELGGDKEETTIVKKKRL